MDLPVLTHPERLWWLLALPLLWWLARPVRPGKTEATPHLALWRRARARLRRPRPRRRWLRLLLLAVAFAATVFAWAGARVPGSAGPRRVVVLLDASASMAARVSGASAWERAVARLRERFEHWPPHVEVELAVLGAGGVRVHRGDRARLLEALPARPSGRPGASLERLAADLAAEEGVATWTLTDGLGPTAAPQAGGLDLVGAPADNVAITDLTVRDGWPLPDVVLEVEVGNFSAGVHRVEIVAEGDAWTGPPGRVELEAGQRVTLRLAGRRLRGGAFDLVLRHEPDALAADDVVRIELPAPPAPRIAVLQDQDAGPFARAAAQALAAETGGEVVQGESVARASFLLVEGGVFEPPPGMRGITFGARPPGHALQRGDLVTRPVVVDWSRQDPLTRGLDLSDLQIDVCLREFAGGGRAVVFGDHGPLLVVDEGEDRAAVHAAFRLTDSNLPLLAAFPQLLRRAFARSYGRKARPVVSDEALLDAAESDLRVAHGATSSRPLPEPASPDVSLVVPLLVLAMAAVALRVYV